MEVAVNVLRKRLITSQPFICILLPGSYFNEQNQAYVISLCTVLDTNVQRANNIKIHLKFPVITSTNLTSTVRCVFT
jgi:hypothetical protein